MGRKRPIDTGYRKWLVVGVFGVAAGTLLALTGPAFAEQMGGAAGSLVSDAEATASAKAFAAHPGGPAAEKGLNLGKSNPMAPTIEVLEPHVDAATNPPFDVRVVAHPHDGLAIDHNSIRVRYGFFRIDVTQRMLALGHWQGNEFIVNHANAPAGTHWFYVSLADTARQEANVAVKVVVK
ncbi:hypothetical protein [Novosphingobium sp.]|uniref:hypothetical protein n=1 Tax=Novosphingobium sp. TaxID=1874826 RepID=UPI003BAD84D9